MIYNHYQVYGSNEPIVRGSLNVPEVLKILNRFKEKQGYIPEEVFVSEQFKNQEAKLEIEVEGKTIKLVPTNHIFSTKEIWIGVQSEERNYDLIE